METNFIKSVLGVAIATSLTACNLTVEMQGVGKVLSGDGLINCPGKCVQNYELSDSPVLLTAIEGPGYQFVGFQDASKNCLNGTIDSFNTATCHVGVGLPKKIVVLFEEGRDYCPDDPTDNCIENPWGDTDDDGILNGEEEPNCKLDPNLNCGKNKLYSISSTDKKTLGVRGGGGGGEQTYHCPINFALVGIDGRSGTRVDSVVLKCQVLTSNGGLGVDKTTSGRYGSGGGGDFIGQCPAGQMVNRVFGRSGNVIDKLGFSCADLATAEQGQSKTNLGPWGGDGGGEFADSCGANYVVTGVKLRTGNVVDSVQFTCSKLVWRY